MRYFWFSLLFFTLNGAAQRPVIQTSFFTISFSQQRGLLWEYKIQGTASKSTVFAPEFEIDNQALLGWSKQWAAWPLKTLRNGTKEQSFEGEVEGDRSLRLVVTFRWAENNPMVRFRYTLHSNAEHQLTKTHKKDQLRYGQVRFPGGSLFKEIRLSEFNEKVHATYLTQYPIAQRYIENEQPVMGPIVVGENQRTSFLFAYEHGSQFPDRFLNIHFKKDSSFSVDAVKGNYLHLQKLNPDNPFETIWLELGGVSGNETNLASSYRSFVLKYLSNNLESRKPFIFYNTWGRQERVKWSGGKYLSSMNLETTLQEIEVAHKMGIEVYVIDAGWFNKTGDWRVNLRLFPDSLKRVKALLDRYNMKMGLWFNPLAAALSSDMLQHNRSNTVRWGGKEDAPFSVWETEESMKLSLVSPYWEQFADRLIELSRTLGVRYFKWDAIGQYGSDAAGHFNGSEKNTAEERAESYAFQLPIFMSKVIDKVGAEFPESIFDFDITEEGRSVGLSFLASGKYFIMNNGPYFHNFDLAAKWSSPLPDSNANIFVHPGPARGWFTRSVLSYDQWIPSILFLTHYQLDGSANSQLINLASLILGQNGIWGEILKLTPEGIELCKTILDRYKKVREDITLSDPIRIGEPGGSPEVYEKINKSSGKGAVVIFANAPGTYTYITQHAVHRDVFKTAGVAIQFDAKGRAIITAEFKESSAKILFFGTD